MSKRSRKTSAVAAKRKSEDVHRCKYRRRVSQLERQLAQQTRALQVVRSRLMILRLAMGPRTSVLALEKMNEAHNRHSGEESLSRDFIRNAVIVRDKSTCYLCRRVLERHEITLDHYIPIVCGGTFSIDNLRVACDPCNTLKGDRLYEELDLRQFRKHNPKYKR
jgi:hypothetical protein